MKLKLYVWENVLQDWAYGIAFALAEDETHAWQILDQEDKTAGQAIRREGKKPREVTAPEAFVVWGGS